MAYYIGDVPAEDIVIEPARNSEPIDLLPFDSVEVDLLSPSFQEIPSAGFLGSLSDEPPSVVIEWPGDSVLTVAGMYSLLVTLVGPDHRERLAPVAIVVQDDDGWQTLDSARADWFDAPTDDRRLFRLLEQAKGDVIQFAPAMDFEWGERPPLHYAEGQLMHARNIWNASKVDAGSGAIGNDSFAIKPFPLDWAVKQTLRPKTALGFVG